MKQNPPSPTASEAALAAHDRLVAALRRPGACAGQPEAATLIETHISSLLLAGPWVFKLKKPVALPFVDFSRLDLRRQACDDELRLNRRTAPRCYLAVLPVLAGADGPRIPSPGEAAAAAPAGDPLDWAVMMRRFDDNGLFSRLAAAGQLTPEQVDALAAAVARFHAQQAPAPPGFGRAEATRHVARQNMAELAVLAAGTAAAGELQALQQWTESRGGELAPLMDLRCRTGHVREVHGDLHLGNIVWADEAPLLFDALEFNDSLRHIDTVGDLAFPFMDLVAAGLPRLAWRFVSAVLDASGDHACLPLLRWWAVHRATVRAKVAWLTARQPCAQGQAPADPPAEARRYLGAARALAQLDAAARRPQLVLTCGLSGSGKSRVAAALAEGLGAVRVRSDVERKRLFALPPTARSAPGLYAPESTRRTYERLAELADQALAGQVAIVVDAASLRRSERDALRAVAAHHGAHFSLVVCQAPPAVLQQRVLARQRAGDDPSDATVEVLARQQAMAEWPGPEEATATLWLDTDCPPDQLARRIEALPL